MSMESCGSRWADWLMWDLFWLEASKVRVKYVFVDADGQEFVSP